MRKLALVCAAIAVALYALPGWAKEGKPDDGKRPGPDRIFKYLDKNDDGQLSVDELPPPMVQRHKEALKKADTNNDKLFSPEEFAAAVSQFRRTGGAPPWMGRGPRPMTGRPGPGGPPWMHRPAMKRPGGPPSMACRRGPHSRPGASVRRPGSFNRPSAEEIFKRLDRDGDKVLSLDEFKTGMRKLHAKLQSRRMHTARGPHRPHGFQGYYGAKMRSHRHSHHRRMDWLAKKGKEMFRKADKNDDGKVSLSEVPDERKDRFQKLLAKADRDGDRALSAQEARRMAAAVMQRVHARHSANRMHHIRKVAIERFKAADANDDGKLSREEAPERLKEHFGKIDRNGDNQLTPDELKKAWAAKRSSIAKKMAQRRSAGCKKSDAASETKAEKKSDKAKKSKPKVDKPKAKKSKPKAKKTTG